MPICSTLNTQFVAGSAFAADQGTAAEAEAIAMATDVGRVGDSYVGVGIY